MYSAVIKCPWVEAFPIINRKIFEHNRDMKRTEGTPKTLGNNATWRDVLEALVEFKVKTIYLFYHIFPSTQHTSFEFTATCFDLTSHLQAYLWTLNSYNLPVRIWDPRWLTCVFAYNVISMYYCIYVCIGVWRVCCCCVLVTPQYTHRYSST